MNFNNIILKNFKNSISHYVMYIFSLVISIALYFSFVTLQYTNSINNEKSSDLIRKGSELGSNFLFVIVIVFLMYANHLFIKRRTKEFALYQLIGLTKNNILRITLIEQITMFVVTGFLGILIGVLGSKLLLMILLKIINVGVGVSLTLQFGALIKTFLLMVITLLLIILQNYVFIKKRSILMMITENSKVDENNSNINLVEMISGVLGIIMIVSGYYLALEMFNKFSQMLMYLPFIILFLTVVGAYLFFRSSVSIIFKTLKKLKKGQVNVNDVIFTSSIMNRMKKNALSLTIIAVISAITVTILCFAAISKSQLNQTVESESPNDFTLIDKTKAVALKKEFEKQNFDFSTQYKEVSDVNIKDNHVFTSNKILSRFPTMRVTSNDYYYDKEVKDNKAKLLNINNSIIQVKPNYNNFITLSGNKDTNFKVISSNMQNGLKNELTLQLPVLLVSNKYYEELKTHSNEVISQYGFNFKNDSDINKAEKIAKKIDDNIQSQKSIYDEVSQSSGMLIFVTSFLGLAFLIASGCIVYIKQLDETEDEIPNYRILRKIGYTYQDMVTGLLLKVLFNFGLPLIISLLHAYFAAKCFMGILGSQNMAPVYVVMLFYSLVYALFAFYAYIQSKRTIKHLI